MRQFVLASTKSVAKGGYSTCASAPERSICRNDEAGVCEGDASTGSIHRTACAVRSVSLVTVYRLSIRLPAKSALTWPVV